MVEELGARRVSVATRRHNRSYYVLGDGQRPEKGSEESLSEEEYATTIRARFGERGDIVGEHADAVEEGVEEANEYYKLGIFLRMAKDSEFEEE